jgi:hypothetical protein
MADGTVTTGRPSGTPTLVARTDDPPKPKPNATPGAAPAKVPPGTQQVDQFQRAGAIPPKHWDYPAGLTSGVFLGGGADQAAQEFPGSGTSLFYKGLAANPATLPDASFTAARNAKVIPQIGFESGDSKSDPADRYNLKDLRGALEGKGRLPEKAANGKPIANNIRLNDCYWQLTAWADHLKGQGPIIFRPLSEMNDSGGDWELGHAGNTTQDYAAVWNEMHDLFQARGATNLRWTFDVLAVQGQPRAAQIRDVLSHIPAKNIDNVGMNPYAMKVDGKFESFSSLVSPWLSMFQQTGHGNARPVISEMGVSNNPKTHNVPGNKDPNAVAKGSAAYQALDAQRAQWIQDAFSYARAHHFASVTYFTAMSTNWRVDPGSKAYQALREEIATH